MLVLTGCGRKGPVLPPIKKAPKPVLIQEVFQRGEHILLKWKNPSSYLDGSPLTEVSKIEIWGVIKSFQQGEIPSIGLKAFRKQSSRIELIPSRDFPEYVEQGHESSQVLVYRYRLKSSQYQNTVFF
ncbi:MAG: hypothetical protein GF421_05250, partial [Candidatus Aminicenantes bacterium]|nr:hypothetical protein [Candidatus Aminicenantes bacterium]